MLVTVDHLVSYMDIKFSDRQEAAAEFVLEGLQSELESYLRRPIEVGTFTETHVIPSNDIGIPMGSFFTSSNPSDDSFVSSNPVVVSTFSRPPCTVYLNNSPVTSVKSVSIKNSMNLERFYGEAMKRSDTITDAVVAGGTVTFTVGSHEFTKGQSVTVTGVTPTAFNIVNKTITAVSDTTFSVANSGVTGTYVSGGIAVANGSDYVVRQYGIDFYPSTPDDTVTVVYNAGLDGANIKMFKLQILRAASREMTNMHDDVVGIKDLDARDTGSKETGFLESELNAMKRWRRIRIC